MPKPRPVPPPVMSIVSPAKEYGCFIRSDLIAGLDAVTGAITWNFLILYLYSYSINNIWLTNASRPDCDIFLRKNGMRVPAIDYILANLRIYRALPDAKGSNAYAGKNSRRFVPRPLGDDPRTRRR